MKHVISVENMRESDAHTIDHYIHGETLMYRAAMGIFKAVTWQGMIAIVTGGGNNGGDGYALACILADQGILCDIYRVADGFSTDGRLFFDQAEIKDVDIKRFQPETDLSGYDIIVDCLLGTGFTGEVRGLYRTAIEAINKANAYVVSVDINSGMNGDTGKAELAVKSNLTVAIGYLKEGLFCGDAYNYVQHIVVVDIGIRLLQEESFLATQDEIIFPHSGLSLVVENVLLLTPGEVEQLEGTEKPLLRAARKLALQRGKIVRVLGQYPLLTDGYRTYFLESGEMPKEIRSRGG